MASPALSLLKAVESLAYRYDERDPDGDCFCRRYGCNRIETRRCGRRFRMPTRAGPRLLEDAFEKAEREGPDR